MKKIILSILAVLSFTAASAQGLFKEDPAVVKGILPNGLTYYIRHNEEPKDRAYFYIAQKVGAIQENADQRGLAHFLEHMAFNGTKNFPGTSLRSYLERIGVKFGADLNAYTATEETVYNIDNVPTKVDGAIDSCLLILHDWSHNLTLADKDIEEERGVINEEWRSRNSAQQRLNEQMMPVIMAGSKYTDAMPIGTMDIVMNFKPQTLRDYYTKWYRPDLQGIVIVGDVDVKLVEKKIKKMFADIKKPGKDAAERIYYPVPDNKEPIVFIGTDKEYGSPAVTFHFKNDVTPRDKRNSREHMIDKLFSSFVYNMFHDHTRDIAQKPGSPFSLSYIKVGNYFLSDTKRAATGIVSCHAHNGGIEEGMTGFLRELFRVRQHGFTKTEFDRYCKDMLISVENQLKNKDKRGSKTFVNEYVRNFLDNEPYTTIEEEVAFYKEILTTLTVKDYNDWFNSLFREDDSNLVIVLTASQNDTLKLPTKDELIAIYKKVKAEKQTPYVDHVNNLPMLPKEPVAGSVVKEETDAKGRTVMTLSNGAKIIVKKTDLKKDQVMVQSLSRGGYSLYSPEDYRLNQVMSMAGAVAGLGNWTLADMGKNTTGIHASVQAGVAENYQSVAGTCESKDLGFLLKEFHAAMLYPNKDQDAFDALIDRLSKNNRQNTGKPTESYGDSLRMVNYGDNPYAIPLKPEEYKNINYDHLLDLYKRSFSDGGAVTYTVVGDVNLDSLRHYAALYLASIPATGENAVGKPVLDYKPGSRTCIFKKEQETPKANLYIRYNAPCEFTLKNQLVASVLGQVLAIKFTKTIREEAGAAYSPSAGATVDYFPAERASITVRFSTSPEKLELARKLVEQGIDDIINEGPSQEDVDKVIEYTLKTMEGNRTVNKYWQYAMSYEWNHGIDYDGEYEGAVKSITLKDIQEMAKKIKAGQRLECDMTN